MKRTIALPLTVLLAALGCPSAGNAKNNAHQTAFAAAADNVVRASIVRIDDAELGDVANGHSGGRYGPIGDDDRFVYGHTQAKAVALDAPVTIVGSAPYTMAQAKAGLPVYAGDCLS